MTRICIVGLMASWVLLNETPAWADDDGTCDDNQACCLTVRDLLCMSCQELEATYKNGTAPEMPAGKLRGTVIVSPGSRRNPTMSKASRLIWQGKVFEPTCCLAVNRFFGFRMIQAQVARGESWMDGQPALILDYRQTSLVYRDVRDEIRQVAPGLYLGAMYEQRCCCTQFKMFFVLQSDSCCE